MGKFERVRLKDCWAGEASHFTPWLAQEENIARLSEAIDVELEVLLQEHPVGELRSDIVCLETGTRRKIIIENQFDRTNHDHLGKVLTYAAGVDAAAVVWIAEQLREEHRAAIDWLNRVTNYAVGFFGVEIELWRIDGSAPAPRFNVVAKPNEWTEAVSRIGEGLSETDALYLEYWTAVREFASTKKPLIRLQKPLGQTWTVVALGKSNLYLSLAVTRQKRSGIVQLVLTGPRRIARFEALEREKTVIEEKLGGRLEWQPLPEKKESHIRRSIDGLEIENSGDWKRQHELLWSHLDKFYTFWVPRVRAFDNDDEEPTTEVRGS